MSKRMEDEPLDERARYEANNCNCSPLEQGKIKSR